MTESLKNARANLTTSYQTVYTCPPGTTAMIVSLLAANIDGAFARDTTIAVVPGGHVNTV